VKIHMQSTTGSMGTGTLPADGLQPSTVPNHTPPGKNGAAAKPQAGSHTQPIPFRLSGLQTVWSKDGQMLKVTVPEKFRSMRLEPFDFDEMRNLQEGQVGRTDPMIPGGDDAGRYVLLRRLGERASYPEGGWANRSDVLSNHAFKLNVDLANVYRELKDLNKTLKLFEDVEPLRSKIPFGPVHDRIEDIHKSIAHFRSRLDDLRPEIDALLSKNARLIKTPAMDRSQFYEKFGPDPKAPSNP
jgi:hypothetical protein